PAVQRRKSYLPWVAIAATLLLAMLAGVVWLKSQSKGTEQRHEAMTPSAAPSSAPSPNQAPLQNKEELVNNEAPAPRRPREFVARHKSRPVQPVLRQEAILAKEQLMSALKLASEKLNLAERTVQGPTPTPLRNQHNVGCME